MKTTSTSADYHAVGRTPDIQLEKLFLCFQVIVEVRRPNMDKSLVRLQEEGDVPHLRAFGLDCRETTVTDQQRHHYSAATWRTTDKNSGMKSHNGPLIMAGTPEVWERHEVSGKHWP